MFGLEMLTSDGSGGVGCAVEARGLGSGPGSWVPASIGLGDWLVTPGTSRPPTTSLLPSCTMRASEVIDPPERGPQPTPWAGLPHPHPHPLRGWKGARQAAAWGQATREACPPGGQQPVWPSGDQDRLPRGAGVGGAPHWPSHFTASSPPSRRCCFCGRGRCHFPPMPESLRRCQESWAPALGMVDLG